MTTVSISKSAIQDAIRAEYLDAVADRQHWHYVRVWPDGTISGGAEAGNGTYPASEYYREGNPEGNPYPITAWSIQGVNAGQPEDVYELEDCPESEATHWVDAHGQSSPERDERHSRPMRLTDTMIEDLDWDSIMPVVEEKLAEAGYTLDDE